MHTRGKPLAADVDLTSVARRTAGLTGADLANIANGAAIFSRPRQPAGHSSGPLRRRARAHHRGPPAAKGHVREEKRILAYREGGHALMSHLMGEDFPVHKATIVPRGALGNTYNLPEEERFLPWRSSSTG